jgi:hypothetical protein
MDESQHTKCEITISLFQALAWLIASIGFLIAANNCSGPEWAAAAKAWGG